MASKPNTAVVLAGVPQTRVVEGDDASVGAGDVLAQAAARARVTPIQPASEWDAIGYRFSNPFSPLDLSDRTAIEHIEPYLVLANAGLQYAFTGAVSQNFGPSPLDLATVDGSLKLLATVEVFDAPLSNGTYIFGGAVPTGTGPNGEPCAYVQTLQGNGNTVTTEV